MSFLLAPHTKQKTNMLPVVQQPERIDQKSLLAETVHCIRYGTTGFFFSPLLYYVTKMAIFRGENNRISSVSEKRNIWIEKHIWKPFKENGTLKNEEKSGKLLKLETHESTLSALAYAA